MKITPSAMNRPLIPIGRGAAASGPSHWNLGASRTFARTRSSSRTSSVQRRKARVARTRRAKGKRSRGAKGKRRARARQDSKRSAIVKSSLTVAPTLRCRPRWSVRLVGMSPRRTTRQATNQVPKTRRPSPARPPRRVRAALHTRPPRRRSVTSRPRIIHRPRVTLRLRVLRLCPRTPRPVLPTLRTRFPRPCSATPRPTLPRLPLPPL